MPSLRAPAAAFVLDDLLVPGLGLVFCGTAAGTVSARLGQYYAHPQNKFWPTLFETGLTPTLFKPAQYRQLLGLGVGLTDLAKYACGMDAELPSGSLGRDAREALRERIVATKPALLAFTSLRAGQAFFGRRAAFGEQKKTIGATRVWVLPSPSPAANWNWRENKKHWFALAAAAKPFLEAQSLVPRSGEKVVAKRQGEGLR